MKKLVITALTTIAFTAGVLAQGTVTIDNASSAGALTVNSVGGYYSGTFGLEVWAAPTSASLSGIPTTSVVTPGYSVAAYTALANNGFTKVGSWANQTITAANSGTIANLTGGTLTIGIATGGQNIELAIVAWNNNAANFAGAPGVGAAATRAGVLAFSNPTGLTTGSPPPLAPTLSGWGTDLVMAPVPEPSTFALAGLGAAALLIFRRRK